MIIKAETITIIGKQNNIEDVIKQIQEDKNGNINWLVISSEASKKIQDYFVVKLVKKGDIYGNKQ